MFSISSLFSNFDSFDFPRDIDLFDSSLTCSDPEIRQFNDVTSFLRNFEHCQKLYRYRKTKLLEYMMWILNDFVWKWFKKRSHFNFLSRFEMILTKAFFSQEQRELKSIIQKRTKRKVRKTTKRTELKVIETTKKTSKFQNIDTFDFSACNESDFEQYNEITNFLQHLEQCQHLYRKSNLLVLLSKCLCDLASEWFKIQSEFISLKRFDRVLAKTFSKTSVRRVSESSNFQLSTLEVISKSIETSSNSEITNVRVICKLCKQSFNFNNELYEHIRNHEASKLVKNSYFSINAVNLVCEINETLFVSHKSFASSAIQKSTNESASTFRTVTLLKRSSFLFFTFEAKSKSTEKSTTCSHCDKIFNFKKSLREHESEQHSKMHVKNFRFEIDAAESLCVTKKKSIVLKSFDSSELQAFTATSKQIFESAFIFKTVISQKSTHFSIHTSENVTKSKENKSTQCSVISLKSSFSQTFESKHQKITIQKFSIISASFSIDTINLVYETMKKSVIELSFFALFDIFNSARFHQNSEKRRFNQIVIFIQHFQQCQHLYDESKLFEWMKVIFCNFVDIWFRNQSNFIFLHDFDIVLTKTFLERSNLSLSTSETRSESTEKSTTCRHCKQTFKFKKLFRKHKREQHAKKFVISSFFRFHAFKSVCKAKKKSAIKDVTTLFASQKLQISVQKFQKIDVQKHSVVNSFFTSSTSEATCEFVEKSTVTYSSFSQKSSTFFATSRNFVTNTKISLRLVSFNCSSFSIATFEITSKCTKSASEIAKIAKIFAKSIANIRIQIIRIRIKMKIE